MSVLPTNSSLLQCTTNEALCSLLETQFKNDKPYSQLGHRQLVTVNPLKPLELLNDATLQNYCNHGYKDLVEATAPDGFSTIYEPHVYEFATRAYFLMRRRDENIAIILSGVSGSGKTTTHQHLLNALFWLSAHSKREERVRERIAQVQTLLLSFGSAATADNAMASHLASCHTLQFNARGRIVGAYTTVALLDKSRVTHASANYNVFYQLLAGTTAQEKAALHINHTADHFNYLKEGVTARNHDRDAIAFTDLKAALKLCGFKAKTIAQICQLLAAILHLGNVQFAGNGGLASSATTPSSSSNESCRIKNKDTLSLVAAALGVATSKLEATLTHKLKLLGKEFCTAFLTVETATIQRDALARALYTILVLWMVDTCNRNLSQACHAMMSIIEPPSFGGLTEIHASHDLCRHYAAERIHQFMLGLALDPARASGGSMRNESKAGSLSCVDIPAPFGSSLSIFDPPDGLVALVNRESQRLQSYCLDATDTNLLTTLFQRHKDHPRLKQGAHPHTFTIQHFSGPVEYDVTGLLESNLDALSPDFILLFRYSCTNLFVRQLFESPLVATEAHPRDERTIIKAQIPLQSGPWLPSQPTDRTITTALTQTVDSTDNLLHMLRGRQLFEVIHIRPNDTQAPNVFDHATVMNQLNQFHVLQQAQHSLHNDITYRFSLTEFATRYHFLSAMLPFEQDTESDHAVRIAKLIHVMQWTPDQVKLGAQDVWLSFDIWRELENHLRVLEKEARVREREEQLAAFEAEKQAHRLAKEQAAAAEAAEAAAAEAEAAAAAAQEVQDAEVTEARMIKDSTRHTTEEDMWRTSVDDGADGRSDGYTDNHLYYDDRTEVGVRHDSDSGGKRSYSQWGDADDDGYMDGFGPNVDMSKMLEDYGVPSEELVAEVPITRIRQWWVRFVWFCTWWIPSFALRWVGKMHRQDVRMAWREKVTLCLLIFMFSSSIIFFIIGLVPVVCPGTGDLYTAADVSSHQTITDYWVSIHGKVYDVSDFVASPHGTDTYMATKATLEPLAGRDLSYTFPPPLTTACAGLVNDPNVMVTPNESVVLGPFVHYSGPQQPEPTLTRLRDPDWLTKDFDAIIKPYLRGDLVVSLQQLEDDFKGWGRVAVAIDGKVYDLTDYLATAHRYPKGTPNVVNNHYLDDRVVHFMEKFSGTDATDEWRRHMAALPETTRTLNQACLDNAFYIGRLDYRESIRCTFGNYLLLSFAVVMSVVILVKFLAALQFGGAPTPEDQDKFVICQVPCYTEDEESLRKTIDSLTTMTYDDKQKLLFLIADGMIIGHGNDRPTPRILLDILGHDASDDPEPVMFKSVGEGSKQLNYGKVYSGLYMHEGHSVPYVLVVKVGKSTERTKPGNRGKRDSQIICMSFLSKVHFNAEMTPLELEIYRHIKHVIGIDPALYEYILMVDSDTEVYPDALTRLVSCMLHDSRIIGLCGETELCNEDRSWTTMIQVYEYYISHHLVKSFESLFGSVTCLPGCFCMYRIRTANGRQPLIVSPNVIRSYSDNQVDTLHKKNLLHLGEDRYLTTLMMRNFSQYKMTFTPYAKCRTVAPDRWRVLLSQRRRWINSTIHNLLELILLPELCGFCCLSMRFVVMVDLVGTITLPASVIYLAYLIYVVATGSGPIPVIALGMLAGAYGLQALIFIVKRQWQHIGWMVIYLFAIPVFSFLIPIYAFWHFDDFSWGNTRVVVGDKKKQIITTDDEIFDEKMIPLKKWEQYELELQEMLAMERAKSVCSEETLLTDNNSRPGSPTDSPMPHSSASAHRLEIDKSTLLDLPTDLPLGRLTTGLSERRLSQFSVDLSAVLHTRENRQSDASDTANPILPEDEDLEREIRRILPTANLMTLTKKQVRDQLSQRFGVDLTIKKGFINATIDEILEKEYRPYS